MEPVALMIGAVALMIHFPVFQNCVSLLVHQKWTTQAFEIMLRRK